MLSGLQLSGIDETVSVVQRSQYGEFMSVFGIGGWMKDENIRFAFCLQDGAGRDRKRLSSFVRQRSVDHVSHAGRRDSPCAGYQLAGAWCIVDMRWLSG